MSLEKQRHLYEFLIRFNATGFQGAHQISIDRIVDTETGEVVAETLGPALPVESHAIGEIIGSQTFQLLKKIDDLEQQVAELESRRAGIV